MDSVEEKLNYVSDTIKNVKSLHSFEQGPNSSYRFKVRGEDTREYTSTVSLDFSKEFVADADFERLGECVDKAITVAWSFFTSPSLLVRF